jgi:hypothetical protein
MQACQQQRILKLVSPIVLEAIEKDFLGVVMLREGARRACDPHGFWLLKAVSARNQSPRPT